METATTFTSNAKGRLTGFVLFALVVVAAVLIVATATGEGLTNTANAATVHARATQAARCGMNEKTYGHTSPLMQLGIEQQCGWPAEVQP